MRKRSLSALVIFGYGMFAFENAILLGWRLFEDYSQTIVPVILIDFFGFTGVVSWGFGYLMLCLQYNIIRLQSKIQLFTGYKAPTFSTTSSASSKHNLVLTFSWGERFLLKMYKILEWSKMDAFLPSGEPNLNGLKMELRVVRHGTIFKYGLLIMICGIGIMVLSNFFWAGHPDMVKEGITFPTRLLNLSLGCMFEGCILVMVFVMRSFRDSLGFVQELRASFLGLSIPTVAFIIFTYFLGDTEFSSRLGSNTVLIPLLLYDRLLVLFYLYKCYRAKQGYDEASSIQNDKHTYAHLIKIIQNEDLFGRLKASMAEDLCLENALYLQDVMKAHKDCWIPSTFMDNHNSNTQSRRLSSKSHHLTILNHSILESGEDAASSDQLQTEKVKSIYQKYFVSQSPYELNVSSELRSTIALQIKEEKDLKLDIFHPITTEVLKMIFQNNLKKFLQKEALSNT